MMIRCMSNLANSATFEDIEKLHINQSNIMHIKCPAHPLRNTPRIDGTLTLRHFRLLEETLLLNFIVKPFSSLQIGLMC